jgi:hypothetical protein
MRNTASDRPLTRDASRVSRREAQVASRASAPVTPTGPGGAASTGMGGPERTPRMDFLMRSFGCGYCDAVAAIRVGVGRRNGSGMPPGAPCLGGTRGSSGRHGAARPHSGWNQPEPVRRETPGWEPCRRTDPPASGRLRGPFTKRNFVAGGFRPAGPCWRRAPLRPGCSRRRIRSAGVLLRMPSDCVDRLPKGFPRIKIPLQKARTVAGTSGSAVRMHLV